jgi:hypothetical protein
VQTDLVARDAAGRVLARVALPRRQSERPRGRS